MTRDDFVYVLLLTLSLPLAHLIKVFKNSRDKQILVGVVGFVFVASTCGFSTLHSLVTILVNTAIVTYVKPKYCHIVSFVWCFGYLSFFRLCHLLGLPRSASYLNAVQLILTLKMVGLAFEIHDSFVDCADITSRPPKPEIEVLEPDISVRTDSKTTKAGNVSQLPKCRPTTLQIFSYGYSFIGLFTGPYYKYETFRDMLDNEMVSYVDTTAAIVNRCKHLPVIILAFLVLSYFFDLKDVTEESFYAETNLLHRLSYMIIMFTIFRCRLYTAWLLSEVVCMVACLGAYPTSLGSKCGQGPKDRACFDLWRKKPEREKKEDDFDFETIKNIDLYGCELAPTVREGMKSWNMSVQYWLASNVYRRVRFCKSNALRVGVTMLVSAYWHGVHPGYFLSFLLIPFNLMAEDLMIKVFKNSRWSENVQWSSVFYRACWFLKMRSFDYMCMGFLLLTLHNTVTYWSSIYYCGHVLIASFVAVGLFLDRGFGFGVSKIESRKKRD